MSSDQEMRVSSAQDLQPPTDLSHDDHPADAAVAVVVADVAGTGLTVPVRTAVVQERVGFAVAEGPITVGEALEHTADTIGDKPVTVSDARAIQSAETRATGIPGGVKGGPASAALSAVDQSRNKYGTTVADVTIGEVLEDATMRLPMDKIATPEDAARVHAVEARNNEGQVVKGGVTANLQSAATHNQNAGFLPGADGAVRGTPTGTVR